MPFGYALWVWLRSNPMAQAVLAIGAGLALFFTWLALRDRRIRKDAVRDIEVQINEQTQTRVDRAREAASAVTEQPVAERVREYDKDSNNRLGV